MSNLQVKNSDEAIEVQNVYCIGKNYLDHIKEFDTPGKAAEIPKKPVIFLKPNSSVMGSERTVRIPEVNGKKISGNLQNEVELVIVIGKDGEDIPESNALDHVFGYAVGIDFTLRDLQAEQKEKGLPWATSKGFRTSAPVSEVLKTDNDFSAEELDISLKINGETKQSANTSMMIFKIRFIISYLSQIFCLGKGDIIFTGTPAGITTLKTGDNILAEIENIGKLEVTIIE
jgi:2-keto-4-pentenoate hydratase/2-oxohepta-3-ene-1,7-dioic acid hydratase in catechol pathway